MERALVFNVRNVKDGIGFYFNTRRRNLKKCERGGSLTGSPPVDFTIGFISLEFFEEKETLGNKKDASKIEEYENLKWYEAK